MSKLDQRNDSIAAAHASVTEAIRHLDEATTHGDEFDRLMLSGIMRQLCVAREPLAEHLDIHRPSVL